LDQEHSWWGQLEGLRLSHPLSIQTGAYLISVKIRFRAIERVTGHALFLELILGHSLNLNQSVGSVLMTDFVGYTVKRRASPATW